MLMDHTYAMFYRVGWILDLDRFSIQQNIPLARIIYSIQNFHQRTFTSTIFTQESMHFSRIHVKIYIVIGKHTWETLANTMHFQRVNTRMA